MNIEEIGRAFAEVASDPDLWNSALDTVAAAADSAGAVLFPLSGRLPGLPHSRSMERGLEIYLEKGWVHADERYRCYPQIISSGVATDLDIFSEEEMDRHPYYQEFLAPLGTRWCAIVRINAGSDLLTLSLQRAIEQGPYSPGQLKDLARIGEHVSSAATFAHALDHARSDGLFQAFEMTGTAVIMLDRLGQVVRINEAAEKILGPDVFLSEQRVTCRDRGKTRELDLALRSLLWNPEPLHAQPRIEIPREGRRAVQAYMARLVGKGLEIFSRCFAALILVDPEVKFANAYNRSREIFGLTSAEASLATELLAGCTLQESAKARNLSIHTVRNQLRSIQTKTDTRRQSELVAVLARLGGIHPRGSHDRA